MPKRAAPVATLSWEVLRASEVPPRALVARLLHWRDRGRKGFGARDL